MATLWIRIKVEGRDADEAGAAVDTALDAGGLQETILAAATVNDLQFEITSALVVQPSEIVSRGFSKEDLVLLRQGALVLQLQNEKLIEEIRGFNGPNADAHRKRYRDLAGQASALYARLAEVS